MNVDDMVRLFGGAAASTPTPAPAPARLVVDTAPARQLVVALTGDSNTPLTWQVFADDKSRSARPGNWTSTFAEALTCIEEAQAEGAGVFFTVNQTDGRGRTGENIVALRACFCDADSTQVTPVLPPSFWTVTKRGRNPFWLLQPGEPLDGFSAVQQRLAAFYDTDRSVHDLPRVMRLPGTWHQKTERHVLVGFEPGPDYAPKYTLQQLLDAHPAAQDKPVTKKPVQKLLSARYQAPAANRQAWLDRRLKAVYDKARERMWSKDYRHTSLEETCTHARKFWIPSDEISTLARTFGEGSGLPAEEVDRVVDWVERHVSPSPDDDPSTPDTAIYQRIADLSKDETAKARETKRVAELLGVDASVVKREVAKLLPPKPLPKSSFPIDLAGLPWHGSESGVKPIKIVTPPGMPSKREVDENNVICTRPIWPEAIGKEVNTDTDYVKLMWIDQYGDQRSKWYRQTELREGETLRGIPGACVGAGRVRELSNYIADAEPRANVKNVRLTGSLGWVQGEWLWGGATPGGYEYLGTSLAGAGELAVWRRGVDHLLTLGAEGYPALIALAASAGAPLVRLAGKRNPILAYARKTSTGKGSVINYALSIWTDPGLLTIPASSTIKGTQDRSIHFPDVPLFVDEVHRMEEYDQERMLYFLGNGQRRVTSSITQKAIGGERRWGVGFVAGEMEILSGKHGGVGARVIEITEAPLPDLKSSVILQAATSAHSGAGLAISARMTAERKGLLEDFAFAVEKKVGSHVTIAGDDSTALSVIWAGAFLLSEALDLDQAWIKPCMDWLIRHHIEAKGTIVDRAHAAWDFMLDTVYSGSVIPGGQSGIERVVVQNETIAWRNKGGTWDINPRHPRLLPILKDGGGELALIEAWSSRGWIARGDGNHRKVRRRGDAGYLSVLRVTPAAPERNATADA